MRWKARQSGQTFVLLAIVVLVAAAAFVAMKIFERKAVVNVRADATRQRFVRAQDALVSFVAQNERLPCPANPTLDTGDADPNAPTSVCNSPAGTLPWRTLGMSRDDAYDPWGWKISYRVYTGGAGALTQTSGASMVNCNTSTSLLNQTGVSATGTCRVTRDTQALPPTPMASFITSPYLLGKGLTVNNFGSSRTDTAFVLVSHGPSGYGAYTAAGVRKTLPTSVDELANTSTTGPFVAKAFSDAAVGPESANFFDDVLASLALPDLIIRTNLIPRDWGVSYASIKFDTPTLTAALGRAATYGDLGQSTVYFTSAHISGFTASGSQNLSFATIGGVEGIGVASGGGSSLTSAVAGQGVRVDLNKSARQLAITLNNFGTGVYLFFGFFPVAYSEQFEVRFFTGGSLQNTNIYLGCRPKGGLASYSIDAGGDYDRVEVRPLKVTPGIVPLDSTFLISELKTCPGTGVCQTSLSAPGNTCP